MEVEDLTWHVDTWIFITSFSFRLRLDAAQAFTSVLTVEQNDSLFCLVYFLLMIVVYAFGSKGWVVYFQE
jgi:hypothetical protein